MSGRRRTLGALVAAAALALAACAPALPPSAVQGTEATIGLPGAITSTNAAAAPSAGNRELAAATRSGFGEMIDGSFVADVSFGEVQIAQTDPFIVRYDLAEPEWSDGTPLDAADLLLGWAAQAGLLRLDDDGQRTPASDTGPVPTIDEFARTIDVRFAAPTATWQQAIEVAVPAHAVGELALGLDDPMQAKQAVIVAIQQHDDAQLDAIAAAWHDGFSLPDAGDVAPELLLSSGPYVIEQVAAGDTGRTVTLRANAAYRGALAPQISRVHVVPAGDDPLSTVGDALDVTQLRVSAADADQVAALERRDTAVDTSHDGTVWTVLLRQGGVFSAPEARAAFLRTIAARDVVDAGGGAWASAYTTTTSVLAAPEWPAYEVIAEDAGFEAIGTPADDPEVDRSAAGAPDGAGVCVLFDENDAFAVGAFDAVRAGATEGGWRVSDCGTDDVDDAMARRQGDAAIVRMPVPRTAAEIGARWGSEAADSFSGGGDADRDELITAYGRTTDVYEGRELLADIEADIVADAVARPLALPPRVTLSAPRIAGVSVHAGRDAPVLAGVAGWSLTEAAP